MAIAEMAVEAEAVAVAMAAAAEVAVAKVKAAQVSSCGVCSSPGSACQNVGFSMQFDDLHPMLVTCMPALWAAGCGGEAAKVWATIRDQTSPDSSMWLYLT